MNEQQVVQAAIGEEFLSRSIHDADGLVDHASDLEAPDRRIPKHSRERICILGGSAQQAKLGILISPGRDYECVTTSAH
jgi:hypothetical protein